MLAAPGAAAQESGSQTPGTTQSKNAQNAMTISAEQLSDHPEDYYGKTVTLRTEVEEVLGPNVFTLDDGEFFGLSPDVLVFAPDAQASPNEDNIVKVTGVVRQFVYTDLQRDYGWGWGTYPWGAGYYRYGYPWYGTVDSNYWTQYSNRPVIIASSVMTRSGMELVSKDTSDSGRTNASQNTPTSGAVGTSGSSDAKIITDLSKLTGTSAQQLVGQRVQLKDVTVDRLAGGRAFWTKASDGARVFVALDEDIQQPNLRQGEHITVAGQVRKTPADRSTIDAKTWGLSDQDVTELMQQGTFVRATALMTSNSNK
jgi:hypothetical protein